MKEFYEEVFNMYFAGMSIRDIALDVGISTEEVKDIIQYIASWEN